MCALCVPHRLYGAPQPAQRSPAVIHTAQCLLAIIHTAQRLPAIIHTAQRLPAIMVSLLQVMTEGSHGSAHRRK